MSAADFPPGIGPPTSPETAENGHVAPSDNGGATSHLDWLRERHAAITAERTLDKEVPGYDGRLILRFRPVPWRVTGRVQGLLSGKDPDARALLSANADILISACVGVYVYDDDGSLVSLDPTGDDVTIEPRLAQLLGIEGTSARDTLLWLVGNEFVVGAMAGEVMEWTRDASAESAADLMGESGPVVR
jgi:hypothetical protein